MHGTHLALLALAGALVAGSAQAGDAGSWSVRIGGHNVDPKSDNGALAGGARVAVDSRFGPTFNLGYAFTPHLALDVLASLPFEHDIDVGNGAAQASAKHLPPTVSLQYHFLPGRGLDPFVGLGVNYTLFFEEEIKGAPATKLELDASFGLAAQVGLDFALRGPWFAGVDLRWIDIDTDVAINGSDAGTVAIDPLAYGATLGYRF